MANFGRTHGKPNSAVGVKWYYKPAMGRMIGRIPGVTRKSPLVVAINEALEDVAGSADHPVVMCAGKSWKDFVACIRRTMKGFISKNKDKIASRAEELRTVVGLPSVSTRRIPVHMKIKGEREVYSKILGRKVTPAGEAGRT